MKSIRWISVLFLLIGLAACGPVTPATTLPTPIVGITPAPDAEAAIRSYLEAYKVEDFASMYALLTAASQAAISAQDFHDLFTGKRDSALNAMSVRSIDYTILSALTNPDTSDVAYRVTYKTVLFGDLTRDFNVTLKKENGEWRLPWDMGLILPELAGGKRLHTEYVSPSRGDIYDRNGDAIATQADIDALSLVSGEVADESQSVLFNKLWLMTGRRPELIRTDYQNYPLGNAVPVGEASAQAVASSGLLGYGGVQYETYNSRYYGPNLAAQAVGYLSLISPEDYNAYLRLGYSGGERVGVQGIEKWAEDYLHGRNQAVLYVVGTDGSFESALSQVDSQPADSIYLTIDNDLQAQAQAAMDGLPGAIVVMEVNTGRVLAMVSSPGFDPNLYDASNPNFYALSTFSADETDWSTFSRATQGAYPLGSVFKIVSMAAALESGLFTPESTFDCAYDYTELVPLGGPTLHDWTWTHCQDEMNQTGSDTCSGANTQPSGLLTLPQGLMRSCDPWFYHIGYTLFSQGQQTAISDMARSFGLGSATGIAQVSESEGHIPNPTSATNATSIAIGQGDVLVTPLQVARFISAIANGGTLYQPQLVEKIQPVSGAPIDVFTPDPAGSLPVSPANLAVIQDAMRSVSANPRGTAYARLGTFSIPTASKTGTAESGTADPHAWFAGYSLAHNPTKPDIAVVVLVNNKGEGSIWALPIFRRIMEIYYFGQPGAIYPWESSYGVVNPDYGTPAPTPTPGP